MTLVTGSIVTYSYIIEIFCAWYGGNRYERFTHLLDRPAGPYAWLFWLLIFCNCVVPQALWFKRIRTSAFALFVASILINVGMWTERFVLIVESESRDFLPSSWHTYMPTLIDGGIFLGTICLFLFLFLLFLRFVPFIPISELKELRHEIQKETAEGSPNAEGRLDG
jgi:molybdopterin-containing oxidoreductase family membrane subunit